MYSSLRTHVSETVWNSNFQAVRIGADSVHAELYGNRFQGKGKKIALAPIEKCFGKVIAQGVSEEMEFGSIIQTVYYWTKDWVGVLSENHGCERVYWFPRDPVEGFEVAIPPRSAVFQVFYQNTRGAKGDIVAYGCGKWTSDSLISMADVLGPDEYDSIYWTENFVYAQEWEYEGEIVFIRGVPRNPFPNP